ncbi:MAG: hypothetical protein ACOYN5_07440 [Bacteroidales bacterium]
MKKSIFLLAALLAASFTIVKAQTYEEYVKQQQKQMSEFQQKQDEGIKALQKQFEAYVEKRNKEYADFLKQRWESLDAMKGTPKPVQPKPPVITKFDPAKNKPVLEIPKTEVIKPKTDTDQKVKPPVEEKPVVSEKPAVPEKTIIPEREKPKEIKPVIIIQNKGISTADVPMPLIPRSLSIPTNIKASNNTYVDFYGLRLGFEVDGPFRQIKLNSPSETGVSNWFKKAAETDYQILTTQILDYKTTYGMNDWGTLMLAKKVGEQVYMGDNDNSRLFTWFVMLQSGFNLRPGIQEDHIILLMAVANEMYEVPFTYVNNQKYYIHQGKPGGRLKAFQGDFPDAEKPLDLNIYKTPVFASKPAIRNLKFSFQGDPVELKLAYDPGLIAFLNDFPQADIQVYFDAAVSGFLKESAEATLMPFLTKLDEPGKVNFLLSFVQNALQYQTDDQQFKKEKFMLPDQSIHYPACDCEDRSVLFAYLVRSLVGIDVIGLEYPGHIATAVKFSKDQKGDFLMFKGGKYTMADPTYINAPYGMTMPDYASTMPKMIAIKNQNLIINGANDFWLEMNKMGAYRGNNLNDFLIDSKGNYYLTGYFTEGFKYGSKSLTGKSGKRTSLLAKFGPDKNLIWVSQGISTENTTGMAIQMDTDGFPVIAGTYSGDLVMEGKKITSGQTKNDVFVARFNPDGKLQWLAKAGLDTVDQKQALTYLTQFNQNGERIRTSVFNETNSSLNGLYLNENQELVFGGSFQNTTGLGVATRSFAAGNSVNYAELLQTENSKLISNNYEKSIAGLFAAIKLIKNDGILFPGSAAQEALDKANPRFKSTCPNVYSNIGKISMVKNAGNIIEIRTANGEPVYFDKLKVEDKSQVKISSLPNDNEQIDIISKVKVGKMVVWYNLNYIRLDKQTGNLIFDYDSDHTQATLNLKKDILE